MGAAACTFHNRTVCAGLSTLRVDLDDIRPAEELLMGNTPVATAPVHSLFRLGRLEELRENRDADGG